jgi:hypothetical protein
MLGGRFQQGGPSEVGLKVGTGMSSEEPPLHDPPPHDQFPVAPASGRRPPWQISLRSLLLFIAAVALLLGILKTIPEPALWYGITLAAIPAAIVAHRFPSKIIRTITVLMVFQFLGGHLMQPLDCGTWFYWMCRFDFGADVYLFLRLFVYYRVAGWPEPELSLLMQVAIMTSPIWMAVSETYLLERLGILR